MLLPDLLAQLFPPSGLFQMDQVHLICLAGSAGGWLRLLLIVQNTRDRAGQVHVRLLPSQGGAVLAGRIPPLRIEIGPAAVLMARLDIPLHAHANAARLRLLLKGSALIRSGHVIRPQKRAPVHRRIRPPFVPGLALWPRRPSLRQWLLRGRPSIRLALAPLAASEAVDPLLYPSAWQVGELWIHGDSTDEGELAGRIEAAMHPARCELLRLGQQPGVLKAAP